MKTRDHITKNMILHTKPGAHKDRRKKRKGTRRQEVKRIIRDY